MDNGHSIEDSRLFASEKPTHPFWMNRLSFDSTAPTFNFPYYLLLTLVRHPDGEADSSNCQHGRRQQEPPPMRQAESRSS